MKDYGGNTLQVGDFAKLIDNKDIIVRVVELACSYAVVKFVEDKGTDNKGDHQLYNKVFTGRILKLEPEELI